MARVRTLLKEVSRIRDLREGYRSTATVAVDPDPVEFANQIGFEPDPWQVEVLDSDHPRRILCCGRQTGKTSVAGLLATHKALTEPGSTTLVVAPSERQAKLAFNAAASFYRKAGAPVPLRSDRRTGMEFTNGSVVEALPCLERTIRGFSVDLLILDEAAAVPDLDYFALLPSLIATRGDQLLLSTPRGKRGFFHELWHGEDDWQRVIVRSNEVPRIRTEDLEAFRKLMPAEFYQQEFECAFLDTEGSLFSYDDIEAALRAGEDAEAIHLEDDEW